MKTVIKIKSLIGTMVLVSSNNDAPEKIAVAVTQALREAIKSSQENLECNLDKSSPPISDRNNSDDDCVAETEEEMNGLLTQKI